MKYLLISAICFLSLSALSQTEIELRTDGIVVPRMETSSVNAPSVGQVIYDTLTAQLMFYNGNNWMTLGGAFERNGTTVRPKQGFDTDDFVFGREAFPPVTPISDTLFFFDKSKGAFRGGKQFNNKNWAPDSLGIYSFAYGSGTKATGENGATALGYFTDARGDFGATTLGYITDAGGDFGATALGHYTSARGIQGATALGHYTIASGNHGSIALGSRTLAKGNYGSTALGSRTTATGNSVTVMGVWNDTLVSSGTSVTSTSPLLIVGNGDHTSDRSNALVVRKNGEVSFDNYTFPISDGTSNQILATDGSGQLNWANASSPFERNGTTVRQKEGYDSDDFVFGREALPPDTPICDTLFFFDKSKGAFRGGVVNAASPDWSEDSLGISSFAFGESTSASGDYGAIALGDDTEASGEYGATALGSGSKARGEDGATALGNSTLALGDSGATAMGINTTASGDYGATAMGDNTIASGEVGATAMGSNSVANGDYGATALGYFSEASGENGTTALGYYTRASGYSGATAIGHRTLASGNNGATAMGSNTIATGNSVTVVGINNDTIVAAGTSIADLSPLFIVGNGDFGNESNALVVRKNGEVSYENYTFPIADGTASQILATDGSGQLSWISPNSNVAFEKSGNLVHQVTDVDADDFIFGRSTLPPAGNITDKFFFYDQFASSFRGGILTNSNNWNFRGASSFGYGENVAPSGDRSAAFGLTTLAVGENTFAIGEETKAEAINSVAIGRFNIGGGNATSWIDNEALFEIGIGTTDANRVNAVTVNKRGDFHINHSNNGGSGGLKLTSTASATESWRIYTSNSTGVLRFYSDDNGSSPTAWIDDATGAYSSISDGRMKKQTQMIGTVMHSLLSLKAKSYLYNSQELSEQKSIGFIAQEVAEIFPELVSYNQEEDLYGINYSGFSVLAIKAIQEQQEIINSQMDIISYQQREMNNQKSLNAAYEQRISKLESLIHAFTSSNN